MTIRAGALDRVITINAPTTTLDDNGTPSTSWTLFATMNANLLAIKTAELMQRGYGENTSILAGFRIRWIDGLTLDMQVIYSGNTYRIVDIREIGRREALDLITLDVVD